MKKVITHLGWYTRDVGCVLNSLHNLNVFSLSIQVVVHKMTKHSLYEKVNVRDVTDAWPSITIGQSLIAALIIFANNCVQTLFLSSRYQTSNTTMRQNDNVHDELQTKKQEDWTRITTKPAS